LTTVIEVRFKGNRREYFTWPSEDSSLLRLDAPVIVEVERGQDFGVVSALGTVAEKKCQRCGACAGGSGVGVRDSGIPQPPTPNSEPLMSIVRIATAEDRKTAADLRVNEEEVRRTVRDRVRQHALPMKVSDAEWQWDKRKLTIYFTAEQRVDFRALDGIGRCGRQLCISSWLPEGKPVSLSLAKAQGLSLNPLQISGPCGRLLCCLHYEHDFYVQQRKRFPKEGKTLKTSAGNERVISVDIFRERVTLRSEAGETRVVALDQLRV